MMQLPSHIIEEILIHLYLEDRKQFRSINKEWKALIDPTIQLSHCYLAEYTTEKTEKLKVVGKFIRFLSIEIVDSQLLNLYFQHCPNLTKLLIGDDDDGADSTAELSTNITFINQILRESNINDFMFCINQDTELSKLLFGVELTKLQLLDMTMDDFAVVEGLSTLNSPFLRDLSIKSVFTEDLTSVIQKQFPLLESLTIVFWDTDLLLNIEKCAIFVIPRLKRVKYVHISITDSNRPVMLPSPKYFPGLNELVIKGVNFYIEKSQELAYSKVKRVELYLANHVNLMMKQQFPYAKQIKLKHHYIEPSSVINLSADGLNHLKSLELSELHSPLFLQQEFNIPSLTMLKLKLPEQHDYNIFNYVLCNLPNIKELDVEPLNHPDSFKVIDDHGSFIMTNLIKLWVGTLASSLEPLLDLCHYAMPKLTELKLSFYGSSKLPRSTIKFPRITKLRFGSGIDKYFVFKICQNNFPTIQSLYFENLIASNSSYYSRDLVLPNIKEIVIHQCNFDLEPVVNFLSVFTPNLEHLILDRYIWLPGCHYDFMNSEFCLEKLTKFLTYRVLPTDVYGHLKRSAPKLNCILAREPHPDVLSGFDDLLGDGSPKFQWASDSSVEYYLSSFSS